MEDEDEKECRVCRGPAEEGRNLFHPCKCSGSIGLVHQDCLISWLKVKMNRNGKCDLCSTKFKFVPKYADGAPEYLPAVQVMICMGRRIVLRYMPILIRFIAAVFLWLFFLPLFTAYLYQGWMHKPSSVTSRLRWDLITTDAISGAVVAAIIIVSFLSLMSFVDFLRVHWDPQAAAANNNNNRQPQQQRRILRREGAAVVPEPIQQRRQRLRREPAVAAPEPIQPRPQPQRPNRLGAGHDRLRNAPFEHELLPHPHQPNRRLFVADIEERAMERQHFELLRRRDEDRPNREPLERREEMAAHVLNAERVPNDGPQHARMEPIGDTNIKTIVEERSTRHQSRKRRLNEDDAKDDGAHEWKDKDQVATTDLSNDEIAHMIRMQEEQENDVEVIDSIQEDPNIHNVIRNDLPVQEEAAVNIEPLPDVFDPDDDMDLDIHIALDELLGLRGPFPLLLRNLLWLSAFNTVFLGIFAFIPHTTGKVVCAVAPLFADVLQKFFPIVDKILSNIPIQPYFDRIWSSFIYTILIINTESRKKNNLLLLPDISLITLGYLSSAAFVLSLKFFSSLYGKTRQRRLNTQQAAAEPVLVIPQHDDDPGQELEEDADLQAFFRVKLLLGLEIAADFSKVGILLLLKMLILPIFLGICLDLSTLCLFDTSIKNRILFAAHDIFASILIHWVVGITFMLVVTVSVLQLREVTHPDLLAPYVRPQEPQPDLLGNLLKDRGIIHAKRMLISLSIYLTILGLNIWLPANLLTHTGLRDYIPFFRPRFYYILSPQLQIPIECLIFHLSMLSFLEKHKNQIGELQHGWLLRMGRLLDLTDHLIPRRVEKFVNIGFKRESDLSFWSQLKNHHDGAAFIKIHVEKVYNYVESYPEEMVGTSTTNGKRVLTSMGAFPILIDIGTESKHEFPNVIGPYRLTKKWNSELDTEVIHFWKETRGAPIPRPPEGWDDLGFGGAETQGRWAWGAERKSIIEESVAVRKYFFPGIYELDQLTGAKRVVTISNAFLSLALKSMLLFCFSWMALLFSVCFILSGPVALGRLIFSVICLPDRYFHDPAAFAIGSMIIFPILWKSMKALSQSDHIIMKISTLVANCLRVIMKASYGSRKNMTMVITLILWLIILPSFVGLIYNFFLSQPLVVNLDLNAGNWNILLINSWGSGFAFLHIWAALCYVGIFRGEFWIELVGADEDRNRFDIPKDDEQLGHLNNDRENENEFRNKARRGRSWQGNNGKIRQFVNIIISVLFHSEWDKVDHIVLLSDCCLPLLAAFSISLFTPILLASLYRMMQLWYIDKLTGWNTSLLSIFDPDVALNRIMILFTILFQIISASKRELYYIGKFMHRAARDDKYLIGQVLLNYDSSRYYANK